MLFIHIHNNENVMDAVHGGIGIREVELLLIIDAKNMQHM